MESSRKSPPQFSPNLVKEGVRKVLEGLGVDLGDGNFFDTPDRVMRGLREMLTGYYATDDEIDHAFGALFESPYEGMVVVGPIDVTGLCPHHLLPIEYRAIIGYIPGTGGKKLGLSKFARSFRLFASQPAMQETVSHRYVEAVMSKIKPEGIALYLQGRHGCIASRGVLLPDCAMITQDVRGLFKDDAGVKTEFEAKAAQLLRRP